MRSAGRGRRLELVGIQELCYNSRMSFWGIARGFTSLFWRGKNRESRQEPRGGTAESEDKAESRETGYNGDGDCATDTLPKPTHNRETSTAEPPSDTKACSYKALSALKNAQPTTTVTPTSEPKKALILADTSYSASCVDEITIGNRVCEMRNISRDLVSSLVLKQSYLGTRRYYLYLREGPI